EVVVTQMLACAEKVAACDLSGIHFSRFEFVERFPGVRNAVVEGLVDFEWKRFHVEGLACTDVEFFKPLHEISLGRMNRAKLKDEVQDFEELERCAFFIRSDRPQETDRRRRFGSRIAEEL